MLLPFSGLNLFFRPIRWPYLLEKKIHADSQYTDVWKYCDVYKTLHCLSKNRLYTQMLRIHLISIFTIKKPRALSALASFGPFIVKTLSHVLYLLPSKWD